MQLNYLSYYMVFFTLLFSLSANTHADYNSENFRPYAYWEQWWTEQMIQAENWKEELNRDLVIEALEGLKNNDASVIERYWAKDYIQHNPKYANGRQAVKTRFIDQRPANFAYEIGAVLADGDFVVVHGRVTGMTEKTSIIIDIYKVIHGQIVEHWDVLQTEVPANQSVSGNAMFPFGEISERSDKEESKNRRIVIAGMYRLFNQADVSVLDEYWSENYIQHNPIADSGIEPIRNIIKQLPAGAVQYDIGFAAAEGNYVILHSRVTGFGPAPGIAVDIFRLENGIIQEHWDVLQPEVALTKSVNGNPMFPVF